MRKKSKLIIIDGIPYWVNANLKAQSALSMKEVINLHPDTLSVNQKAFDLIFKRHKIEDKS